MTKMAEGGISEASVPPAATTLQQNVYRNQEQAFLGLLFVQILLKWLLMH